MPYQVGRGLAQAPRKLLPSATTLDCCISIQLANMAGPSKAFIPFLIAMMLLTGVCNTLITKYQVRPLVKAHLVVLTNIDFSGQSMRSQLQRSQSFKTPKVRTTRLADCSNVRRRDGMLARPSLVDSLPKDDEP